MLEEVREAGLLSEGRPVVVLVSGGRDSVCLLDLAVRIVGRRRPERAARQLRAARHRRWRRGALHEAVSTARGQAACAPPPPARVRQPPGLGAPGALRRGRRARPARRGRRGRRSDGDRPGGDDPLPARLFPLAPCAARDEAAGRDPGAPAAGVHSRANDGVLPRAGAALARGCEQRVGRLRAGTSPARTRPRARGRPSRGGRQRAGAGRRAARRVRGTRRAGRRGVARRR